MALQLECPITMEPVVDPVVTPRGHVYSRDAIEKWLATHRTSPMVPSENLTVADLRPLTGEARRLMEGDAGLQQMQVEDVKAVRKVADAKFIPQHPQMSITQHDTETLFSIQPSELPVGPESVFILCLDTSYSMDEEVKAKDPTSGEEIRNGFSLLDVLKYACKALFKNIDERHYVAIVPYSTRARVALPPTRMNEVGKQRAERVIDALATDGQTNIWDAIRQALDMAAGVKPYQNTRIMLLTDGRPNQNPPGGIVATMQEYLHRAPSKAMVHTFGLGYNLDNHLLRQMASTGHGFYTFAPDAFSMGTAIIDWTANVMTTCAYAVHLCIQSDQNIGHFSVFGAPYKRTEWGIFVDVGSVRAGQSRDILVTVPGNITASLSYHNFEKKYKHPDLKLTESSGAINARYADAKVRQLLLDAIRAANDVRIQESPRTLTEHTAQIIQLPVDSSFKSSVLEDLHEAKDPQQMGEIFKSFCRSDWYQRWARHYLPSFMGAHENQICNNFNDKSIQHYGGVLFQQLRQEFGDLYKGLPAPQPSIQHAKVKRVSSMSGYYCAASDGGVCFAKDSLIYTKDAWGTPIDKCIQNLKKGDLVRTPEGYARLLCLVRTPTGGSTELVTLRNGLRITPWHPVKYQGRWVFPADMAETKTIPCEYVYNMVLDQHHAAIVNGHTCVTMGHDFREPVVQHDFFGSQQIIRALRAMDGYDHGLVQPTQVVRDVRTNLIVGMV